MCSPLPVETAKSEIEEPGLPQAEGGFKGIRHSRRNAEKNFAPDRRGRPEFKLNSKAR
jgi:hypothetical protein